jgi:hypothetical protein
MRMIQVTAVLSIAAARAEEYAVLTQGQELSDRMITNELESIIQRAYPPSVVTVAVTSIERTGQDDGDSGDDPQVRTVAAALPDLTEVELDALLSAIQAVRQARTETTIDQPAAS